MSVTGYAYPWDCLDDEGAPAHAASLGVEVVALAATYHATRVATPLHSTRRITEVPHSAVYAPIRDQVWRHHRLHPRAPEAWVGPDSFDRARDALTREGLAVDGWIVLTHDDDLGADHRDLLVRNAFSESYSYALCPSAEDVRDYCRTLVQEVLRNSGLRGVVLEASGPMGVDHGSAHDRVDLAGWSEVERQLLSICFCPTCEVGLSGAGIDPADVARRTREALTSRVTSMEEALGDYANPVADYRVSVATSFQRELMEAAREVQPSATITLHASANPWATGSFSTTSRETLAVANGAVANCWDPGGAQREVAGLAAMTRELGAYLRLDREWGRVGEDLARYASLGVKELHLYHLGLLSQASAATAAHMVTAWKSRDGDALIDQVEESLNDG